jgi:SAM-dependent methyltransferase
VKLESKYDLWHQEKEGAPQQLGIWYRWANSILERQDVENKVVLEIGCGRGMFVDYVCGRQYPPAKYYGCDFSIEAIQIAREKYQSYRNAIWQCEDIQSLSFVDNSFDTIISCETIEHIPHPGKGLSELHRVLKHGGKLILTCPNYFNLFGIWCIYRKVIGKPYTEGGQPYVNYILMPSILFKLKNLGLVVEHVHSSELILPARVPRTYYSFKLPSWLTWFGHRTYYVLRKK